VQADHVHGLTGVSAGAGTGVAIHGDKGGAAGGEAGCGSGVVVGSVGAMGGVGASPGAGDGGAGFGSEGPGKCRNASARANHTLHK